ncbi:MULTISPECIES: cupin domain-containing protein [unclassified Pseudonocardia]|mgnify:CR=1 FL=1|jgi:quercetin dioxygenase-like cupin family protein|uniref:cupin domain-containing protein n=1 Tax=unclassified Pseudonocardia TaxID=2619320 RepID=UPI000960484B|nr:MULTISPECIES: cupin domain-containing protein [unclassified Pseudonocardia]MBN9099330.1 cupin domain-containing protein [Pseudonocardia sp.]OJY53116.1 MAG: hypothetical protein BGP03_01850 [Pseudonocardia sp. 73-21]
MDATAAVPAAGAAAVIDAPGEHTGGAWWFLDTLVVEHRFGTDTGPVVLEVTLPAGASPPLHVHQDADDSWYVLDGQLVVRCGGREWLAGPGHWVSMPRGVAHSFRVVGGRAARILIVLAEDSFLRLVRELGQPAAAIGLPVATGGPGMQVLSRAMAAHDITTVGASITEDEAHAFLNQPR